MVELNDGYCMARGSVYIGGNESYLMSVYKSENQGLDWNRYFLNEKPGDVYDIALDPDDPNTVYAGGGYQQYYLSNWVPHLFKTTTGGSEWIEITPNDWSSSGNNIQCLVVDPFDSQRIWAGLNTTGLWLSQDGGQTWESSLPFVNAKCLIAHPKASALVFCGSYRNGLLFTTDGGNTWNEMNDGLPDSVRILCMDLDLAQKTLYIGTEENGVYRCSLGALDVGENADDTIPDNPVLEPNYPNPFNTVTRINFRTPKPEYVLLYVCDIRGRAVRTLINADYSAGKHETIWDGRDNSGNDLPSGLYIGRLEAGETVRAIKLVLQR
jgi:photosystem II stability/assembly factor-like uncharacterized protein